MEELRAQLQLAETNARDLESEDEAQVIASELDVLRQREAEEPGAWVDGMPIAERMQELEAQLRLAQQARPTPNPDPSRCSVSRVVLYSS